jgi:hypothetical protein
MILRPYVSVAALCVAGAFSLATRADAQAPAPAPAAGAAPAAPAAAPSTAISLPYNIQLTGHVEAGVSVNPDSPSNNINFGQTFTDQANSFRMNQLTFAIERDLDPKNAGWQWGFRFQPLYGTDARVEHFMNEFDRSTSGPYQFDIVEMDGQAHIPTIGGGTDVKFGQYPTPLGEEVIDALGNTFYSHSYIFQYGLPYKHTGLLTTTHINDTVDLWLGLDTGVNNSVGDQGVANNFFPKFLGGIGLNGLMGGNLTVLALAHVGPENASYFEATNPAILAPVGLPTDGFVAHADSSMREYFDVVTTYKINDSWQTVNELNLIHDDLFKATGGGAAQYLMYSFNDQWSFAGRAEVFADNHGFFVCTAQEAEDYANIQRGLAPNVAECSGNGPTPQFSPPPGVINVGGLENITYGEITLGANYKPAVSSMANVLIRPEIRYDTVIGGSQHASPFDVNALGYGTKTSQITLAIDGIIGF